MSTPEVTHRSEDGLPNPFFHTAPGTGVGAFVVDKYGRRGRIYEAHYGCQQSAAWLAMQTIKPSTDTKRWVSILIDDGGSVTCPETDVTPVEPFVLRNNHALMTFGSDDPWSTRTC